MKIVRPKRNQVAKKQERLNISPPSTYKAEIIKTIQNISGRYSVYDVFSDWVEMSAISLQNGCMLFHNDLWNKREERYLSIVKRYTKDELNSLVECFAKLVLCFENFNFEDVLGSIYMHLDMGNKKSGQFFTPYDVSKMMALMTLPSHNSGEPITLCEPTCGGGGMIIAACDVLHERGINFQRVLKVVAQDVDWKPVYMTYIQLSLLGVNAEVVQGDSLAEPYKSGMYPPERVFYTPARMGMLL